MKIYLIDTHILLWLIFDPGKIDDTKMAILKDSKNKIYVASITFWEVSIKYNLGKLSLEGLTPEELPNMVTKMGLEILNIDSDTMASFYKLPKIDSHKDPFDRIIIWKCINDNITLVSQDSKLKLYQTYGLKYL